jgi:hypothetical protein
VSKDYRLVWFQHFHKAAGSSIVKTAQVNNETPFPKHENGNPCDEIGKLIPLESYSVQQLKAFVDSCEQKGITFVACEWDIADYAALKQDPRITLITCVREPLKRFVSDYYYSYYRGSHDHDSLESHLKQMSESFKNDYYCRMLGRQQNSGVLEKQALESSKEILCLFDHVCVLEKQDSLKELYNYLGWDPELAQLANKTGFKTNRAIRYFFKGKSYLTKRHKTHPQVEPTEEFKAKFNAQNVWDVQLYQWLWNNESRVP